MASSRALIIFPTSRSKNHCKNWTIHDDVRFFSRYQCRETAAGLILRSPTSAASRTCKTRRISVWQRSTSGQSRMSTGVLQILLAAWRTRKPNRCCPAVVPRSRSQIAIRAVSRTRSCCAEAAVGDTTSMRVAASAARSKRLIDITPARSRRRHHASLLRVARASTEAAYCRRAGSTSSFLLSYGPATTLP